MKNIPIKFRAKNIGTGEYVYGDLIQAPVDLPTIRVWNAEECKNGFYAYDDYEVYPDSVCQLVGYDAAGNEVYEGDLVKAIRYADHPEYRCTYYGYAVLKTRICDPDFELEDEGYMTADSWLDDDEYCWVGVKNEKFTD